MDGRPLADLGSYRASPVFSVTVPEDNLYDAFGFPCAGWDIFPGGR